MTENIFHVPLHVWASFDQEGKKRFNNVMGSMLDQQAQYAHPMAIPMPELHWRYLCYQAGCLAASNKSFVPDPEDIADYFSAQEKLINIGYTKN